MSVASAGGYGVQAVECVAGIYVERTGARLLLMSAARQDVKDWWTLSYIAHEPVSWHPAKKSEAVAGMRYLLQIVRQHPSKPQALGVACNGPFVSLNPSTSKDYGRLHRKYSDPPLRGQSLSEIIRSELGDEWGLKGIEDAGGKSLKPFVIHTDANACALGEAYNRNLIKPDVHKNRTLAFVCCCEGIGLGITRGPSIIRSALHPEVGLMPPRIMVGDPLRPDKVDIDFASSIAELANDKALIDRLKAIEERDVNLGEVVNFTDEDFWDVRAYYLSQVCLACNVIIPPNMIAIGARIDPLGDVGQRTRSFLRDFFKKREDDNQPLIEYQDAKKNDFVSNSLPHPELPIEHSLATTGALGMCYSAVSVFDFGTLENIRTYRK